MSTAYLIAHLVNIGPFYIVERVQTYSEERPTRMRNPLGRELQVVLLQSQGSTYQHALERLRASVRLYPDLVELLDHGTKGRFTVRGALGRLAASLAALGFARGSR